MLLFADVNSKNDYGDSSTINENDLFRKLSKYFNKNNLDADDDDDDDVDEETTSTIAVQTTLPTDDGNDETSPSPNYIYRRRCQMKDDWGPIGLNCTADDVEIERVPVIGFIVNWIRAYIHIKREFL